MRRLARGNTDAGWKKLVEIARLADRDDWRSRLRGAWLGLDRPATGEAGGRRSPPRRAAGHPPPAGIRPRLTWCAMEKARAVLLHAQRLYPDDLWINDTLALLSLLIRPPGTEDALRYLHGRLALRPRSPRGLLGLAGSVSDERRGVRTRR